MISDIIRKMKTIVVFTMICGFAAVAAAEAPANDSSADSQTVTINGIDFEVSGAYRFFTWDDLPADVSCERQPVHAFTNPAGVTHYYQAIHVASGNLNWFQAAYLAQEAGGYLASLTSATENYFVFSLVSDEKYFWRFPPYDGKPGRMNHHEISIGPFIGGFQPVGSAEPSGGWTWLSGEPWGYSNWAVNLDDGITDTDPRDNTQPNDSGNGKHGQRVMGFGEMNVPVATWGDYMDDVGTYGQSRTPGRSFGFVIEYENRPSL